MKPTDETLGSLLLVPSPAGCPPDLAVRIAAHNAVATAWQARADRLEADATAGRKAVCERVVSPETNQALLMALGAEWINITKEFHFLLAVRVALVDDIRAVAAAIDQEIIAGMGLEIAAAQKKVKWSGWPWRVAGRG
jgi:hypothetical protein